jgi:citrate synthase
MSRSRAKPVTELSRHTPDAIYYRNDSLVNDLIGKVSFIDVFMSQAFGRKCSEVERRMVDAVLVTLMEHGMTPSAIAARLVYSSSPESLQAGVAAGLLAVGTRFVGTMEQAGVLLGEIVSAKPDGLTTAAHIVETFRIQRTPVPGFGHHLHRPDDPRALCLLDLSRELGIARDYVEALGFLAVQIDVASERHVTINATGAVAAVLGDMGIPASLMRGFAVLARVAGLISHIAEEQRDPSGRFIWDLVDNAMNPES